MTHLPSAQPGDFQCEDGDGWTVGWVSGWMAGRVERRQPGGQMWPPQGGSCFLTPGSPQEAAACGDCLGPATFVAPGTCPADAASAQAPAQGGRAPGRSRCAWPSPASPTCPAACSVARGSDAPTWRLRWLLRCCSLSPGPTVPGPLLSWVARPLPSSSLGVGKASRTEHAPGSRPPPSQLFQPETQGPPPFRYPRVHQFSPTVSPGGRWAAQLRAICTASHCR